MNSSISSALIDLSVSVGEQTKQMDRSQFLKSVNIDVHLKKLEKTERRMVQRLQLTFDHQVRSARESLLRMSMFNDRSVDGLMDRIFDPREWDKQIIDDVFPVMAQGMAESAIAFVLLMGVDIRGDRTRAVRSTATEWLQSNGVDLPPGVSTELPEWLQQVIKRHLRDVFKQPYWMEISETTRRHIRKVIEEGLIEGYSLRKIAKEIHKRHPRKYSLDRARKVARTEAGNALNAARDASLVYLKEQLGEAGKSIGKSWTSVLIDTTRDSHANLDGVLADADGMWTLGGIRVPWPGHPSLPAEERINCLCTIQTEFGIGGHPVPKPEVIEEVLKPKRKPRASKPKPETPQEDPRDPNTWKKWSLFERLEKIPQLQEIVDEVVTEGGKSAEKIQKDIAGWQKRLAKYKKKLEAVRISFTNKDISEDEFLEEVSLYEDFIELMTKNIKDSEKILARSSVKKEGAALFQIPASERGTAGIVFDRRVKSSDLISNAKQAKEFFETHADPHLVRGLGIWVNELDPGRRPFAISGTINVSPLNTFADHVHEIGHLFENVVGADKSIEFVQERIRRAGTPNVPMKRYSAKYEDHEMGNEDDFNKALIPHHAAYVGKMYKTGGHITSTEVVSMGVELLATDPKRFAEKDPEYFKFIVGFLRGWLQ